MKIYLVGGAVRDQLLGYPVQEKDWVVVGATVAEMLQKGFRPVGKDFPVFLHPETNEEYALARTERKNGRGYTGFDFNTSPDVTLEEDLMRRDLTINAMAQTPDGVLIDPYQGKCDLEYKLLRHVSPAFMEDPVRILRIARFAARYAHLGFHVAPDTLTLMRQMVSSGEVDALVAERVWKELERALAEKNPEAFFNVLADCYALVKLFPHIDITGKGIQALVHAVRRTTDADVRFAVLWHEVNEVDIKSICNRYRVPNDYRDLALLVSRHLKHYQDAAFLTAGEILKLLQSVDAFRREERFKKFLVACEATSSQSTSERLLQCCAVAKGIDIAALLAKGFKGRELADKIDEAKREAIQKFLSKNPA